MPLNERQKEFRKQMQNLENNKLYKEIIDDHNSFYNNKAYDIEVEFKKEKSKKNIRRIIYFLIISFIGIGIHKNIDKIDFNKIKAITSNTNFMKNNNLNNNDLNKNIYNSNDVNQFEVANYHKNYGKRIETLNIFLVEIYNNFDITKANEQIKIIDELTYTFNNYNPEPINANLHNINKSLLEIYKGLFYNLILLNSNQQDNNIITNYNYYNNQLVYNNNLYREELLNIFKAINMTYSLDNKNNINFTYKEIK